MDVKTFMHDIEWFIIPLLLCGLGYAALQIHNMTADCNDHWTETMASQGYYIDPITHMIRHEVMNLSMDYEDAFKNKKG